jgi:hypothetical protein
MNPADHKAAVEAIEAKVAEYEGPVPAHDRWTVDLGSTTITPLLSGNFNVLSGYYLVATPEEAAKNQRAFWENLDL